MPTNFWNKNVCKFLDQFMISLSPPPPSPNVYRNSIKERNNTYFPVIDLQEVQLSFQSQHFHVLQLPIKEQLLIRWAVTAEYLFIKNDRAKRN